MPSLTPFLSRFSSSRRRRIGSSGNSINMELMMRKNGMNIAKPSHQALIQRGSSGPNPGSKKGD